MRPIFNKFIYSSNLFFSYWNDVFLGVKRFVSLLETKCFTPRNKKFQSGLKLKLRK